MYLSPYVLCSLRLFKLRRLNIINIKPHRQLKESKIQAKCLLNLGELNQALNIWPSPGAPRLVVAKSLCYFVSILIKEQIKVMVV